MIGFKWHRENHQIWFLRHPDLLHLFGLLCWLRPSKHTSFPSTLQQNVPDSFTLVFLESMIGVKKLPWNLYLGLPCLVLTSLLMTAMKIPKICLSVTWAMASCSCFIPFLTVHGLYLRLMPLVKLSTQGSLP